MLRHTFQALLLKNATVYIGARSIAKAEAAINSLVELTGNRKVFLLQMDLADLHSVKKAADEFQK
jgi:retinol dehydrogenase 12